MIHVLSGNLAGAELVIEESVSHFGIYVKYEQYLAPIYAIICAAKGDYARALQEIEAAAKGSACTIIGSADTGMSVLFTGLNGNTRLAKDLYHKLLAQRNNYGLNSEHGHPHHRIPAFHLALAALGSGLSDEAIKWLWISAIQEREPLTLLLHLLPFLKPLHVDPEPAGRLSGRPARFASFARRGV
jgi:hypothetical protein